jgi:hypothetical protein
MANAFNKAFFKSSTIPVDSQPFQFKNEILLYFVKFKFNIVEN